MDSKAEFWVSSIFYQLRPLLHVRRPSLHTVVLQGNCGCRSTCTIFSGELRHLLFTVLGRADTLVSTIV